MYIARILYPVEVLGPGRRIGIWFCGCSQRCKGCSNPELWDFQERYKVNFEIVKEMITQLCSQNVVDGFTLTGGDPLYQYEDFRLLVDYLSDISEDILVYTGYTLEELNGKSLDKVSVLIDGAYIEERNNGCLLRGSDNQKIHILNEHLKEKYEDYLATAKNEIQNFAITGGFISVGIHRKDFQY